MERILTSSYAEKMKRLAARNEGENRQKRIIALKLLRKQWDDVEIAELVELPLSEIEELKKQMG